MDVILASRNGITEEEVFSTLGNCGEPNVFIDDPKEGTSKSLFWKDLWENWPHWSEVPEFIKSQGWDMGKELGISSSAFNNGGWYDPAVGVVYCTSGGGHYNGVIHQRWWKKGKEKVEALNPLEVFGEEGFQEVERMLDAGLTVRFWMGRSASNVIPNVPIERRDGSGFVQAQVILKAQTEGEMFALKSSLFPNGGWIRETDKSLAEDFVRGHLKECPEES